MAPTFEFEARTRDGKKISGTREAENSNAVARSLKEKNYYVLNVEEKDERKGLSDHLQNLRGVSNRDLVIFSQQFAAIINAGISLVDALSIIIDQMENETFREALEQVLQSVETGSSLSEALAQHPDVFPELYVQLVKAGETGGVLDLVLDNLADHYEKQEKIRNMVKSALYYPIAICVAAVAVVVFLLVMVVPTFEEMFADLGAELPAPTRFIMGASEFIQSFWWLVLIVFVVAIYGFRKYRNSPSGRLKTDKLILKLPVIGKMMRKVYISRFSSTLSMMLKSGVDLLTSLQLVEEVVGNRILSKVITRARMQVREGVNLSVPLRKSDFFPPMVMQMMQVGEETGDIDRMLSKISDFYDDEVEKGVDGVVSLIEPVLIIFLAVVVGGIVLSVLLPMLEMYEQLQ